MLLDAEVLGEGIAGLVRAHVATSIAPLLKRIAELEAREPLRGEKGDPGERGERGPDGLGIQGRAGESGAPGKDGEPGLAGKDADEVVIVEKVLARMPTPRDGSDGKDGKDGAPGTPADVEEMRALVLEVVRKTVDALPPARDGRDGRDAIDGLIGIEGDYDGERNFKFVFIRSAGVRQEISFKAPIPIFLGVHQEGRGYTRGDNVTRNGCQWTCLADTTTTPPSADWQQSTKAGRDGRDK